MNKILTLKDTYINSDTTISVNGRKFKIGGNITQNQMNTLYNLGYTEFFDVVESVSLVDDTIYTTPDLQIAFEGVEMTEPQDIVIQSEPTPQVTPQVKKKSAPVKAVRIEGEPQPLNQKYRDN